MYFSKEKTPWTEKDYKKFQDAMELFDDQALANKKIAQYMGSHIDSNHVRYERQKYKKKVKCESAIATKAK